jgi:hypothetical protein
MTSQKTDELIKIEFKHKRMPIGYLSSPDIEMVIIENHFDNSQIIRIQPKVNDNNTTITRTKRNRGL